MRLIIWITAAAASLAVFVWFLSGGAPLDETARAGVGYVLGSVGLLIAMFQLGRARPAKPVTIASVLLALAGVAVLGAEDASIAFRQPFFAITGWALIGLALILAANLIIWRFVDKTS